MTEAGKARFHQWWPVIATVIPIILAGFVAWSATQSRIAVLEARISMHEDAQDGVTEAVDRRLATIESDIKQLLQRSNREGQ